MLRMYVSGLYGNLVLEMVPISFFVIWSIEEVHVCKVQVVAVLKKTSCISAPATEIDCLERQV